MSHCLSTSEFTHPSTAPTMLESAPEVSLGVGTSLRGKISQGCSKGLRVGVFCRRDDPSGDTTYGCEIIRGPKCAMGPEVDTLESLLGSTLTAFVPIVAATCKHASRHFLDPPSRNDNASATQLATGEVATMMKSLYDKSGLQKPTSEVWFSGMELEEGSLIPSPGSGPSDSTSVDVWQRFRLTGKEAPISLGKAKTKPASTALSRISNPGSLTRPLPWAINWQTGGDTVELVKGDPNHEATYRQMILERDRASQQRYRDNISKRKLEATYAQGEASSAPPDESDRLAKSFIEPVQGSLLPGPSDNVSLGAHNTRSKRPRSRPRHPLPHRKTPNSQAPPTSLPGTSLFQGSSVADSRYNELRYPYVDANPHAIDIGFNQDLDHGFFSQKVNANPYYRVGDSGLDSNRNVSFGQQKHPVSLNPYPAISRPDFQLATTMKSFSRTPIPTSTSFADLGGNLPTSRIDSSHGSAMSVPHIQLDGRLVGASRVGEGSGNPILDELFPPFEPSHRIVRGHQTSDQFSGDLQPPAKLQGNQTHNQQWDLDDSIFR